MRNEEERHAAALQGKIISPKTVGPPAGHPGHRHTLGGPVTYHSMLPCPVCSMACSATLLSKTMLDFDGGFRHIADMWKFGDMPGSCFSVRRGEGLGVYARPRCVHSNKPQMLSCHMSTNYKDKIGELVGVEVIEKNGIDVEKLRQLLLAGVGAEFTTYYYYTILRMHCTGQDGEGLKEIVEDARIEDRNHFEAMVPRLYEIGGALPRDIRKFADIAGCPDAYLPDNWEDVEEILKVLLEAERCAIRSWGEVCDYTQNKDHRTYAIAQAIMQEEIEHEAWFVELLTKRPSGHFRRSFVGQSPHTKGQGGLIHL